MKNFSRWLYLAFAAMLLVSGCSTPGSQGGSVTQDDRQMQSDRIRVGDRLIIRITGTPDEKVLAEPVDSDGDISMPHLGRIKAVDKEPNQLEREIESLYIQRKIYTNPNITISQEARFISVIGEVKREQRVAFTQGMTALSAISDCGGFTEYANKKDIYILRGNRKIPFNAVAALRDPKLDLPLRAGDKIQVPRTIF